MTRHTNTVTYVEPHDTLRFQRLLEHGIGHVSEGDAIQWLSRLRKNPGVVLVSIDDYHARRALRQDTQLWHGRIADTSEKGVLFGTLQPWERSEHSGTTGTEPYVTSEWVPKSQIEFAVAVSR